MNLTKPTTHRDVEYLQYVKSHECMVKASAVEENSLCSGAIDPHHVIPRFQGKVGKKTDDFNTVPLCRQHHDYAEYVGNVEFQEAYGLNFEARILALRRGYTQTQKHKREPSIKARILIDHCPCGKTHKLPLSKAGLTVVEYTCPLKSSRQEAR